MKNIITKDEIKKILKPYTIYERVCMDYKGNISLGVTDKGMLAQEIISKINENIETKLDKTFKKFLLMDLDRASKYAIYRNKILKRMMNDLATGKNK